MIHRPHYWGWSEWWDSNSRNSPAPKAGAIPTSRHPDIQDAFCVIGNRTQIISFTEKCLNLLTITSSNCCKRLFFIFYKYYIKIFLENQIIIYSQDSFIYISNLRLDYLIIAERVFYYCFLFKKEERNFWWRWRRVALRVRNNYITKIFLHDSLI